MPLRLVSLLLLAGFLPSCAPRVQSTHTYGVRGIQTWVDERRPERARPAERTTKSAAELEAEGYLYLGVIEAVDGPGDSHAARLGETAAKEGADVIQVEVRMESDHILRTRRSNTVYYSDPVVIGSGVYRHGSVTVQENEHLESERVYLTVTRAQLWRHDPPAAEARRQDRELRKAISDALADDRRLATLLESERGKGIAVHELAKLLFYGLPAATPTAVRRLLHRGVDPRYREPALGQSLVDHAIDRDRPDVALVLLEAGATPTPFAVVTAAKFGQRPVLEAIAKNGGSVLSRETLRAAASAARVETLAFLLGLAKTPSERAAHAGDALGDAKDVDTVRVLLAAGADPNAGFALWGAIARGSEPVVAALLAAGANPDQRLGKSGYTPLLDAVSRRHPAIVRRLVEAGASVDARSSEGTTALILAAGSGQSEAVTVLLAAGADPRLRRKTRPKHDALESAIAAGKHETATILREYLAREAGGATPAPSTGEPPPRR